MNLEKLFRKRLAPGVGYAVATMAVSALLLPIAYAGAGSKPASTTESHQLSGSDLYTINCGRCHAERYPKEFQAIQWTTLLMHMRVRANLPAKHAREILKYLQSESGN